MSDIERKVLKIGVVGMDERLRNTLNLVFKHRAFGYCTITEDDSESDAVLFDMDTEDASTSLEFIQDCIPGVPKVVLSVKTGSEDGIPRVEKPISVMKLLDAIGKVTGRAFNPNARIETRPETQAAAKLLGKRVDESAPSSHGSTGPIDASNAALYYDRDAFMEGMIMRAWSGARSRRRVAQLTFFARNSVMLDPESGKVHTNIDSDTLNYFGITSLDALGVSERDWKMPQSGSERVERASLKAIEFDHFLWDLSIATSRGRLPMGTAMHKPMYLKHWPNLTRLRPIPEAMRIAAAWVRRPISLLSLHEQLDIPVEYIFSFYSAASALGLAGPAEGGVGEPSGGDIGTPHANQGVFGAILKHLSGKFG